MKKGIIKIFEAALEVFGLDELDLYHGGRKPYLCSCRYVIMHHLREEHYGLSEIAHLMNKKCHKTVINGLKRYDDFFYTDLGFKKMANEVESILKQ